MVFIPGLFIRFQLQFLSVKNGIGKMRDPISGIDIFAPVPNFNLHRKVAVSEKKVVIVFFLKLSFCILCQQLILFSQKMNVLLA